MNGDGNITVTDIVIMAQMIMDGATIYPHYAPARGNHLDRMTGDIKSNGGNSHQVSISIDNAANYTAFQLDLQLPAGMTAENFMLTDGSSSHTLDVNLLDNGKTRLLCYSPTLQALGGNEETLLTFDVTAGDYNAGDIVVDGIEMVTTLNQTNYLEAFTIKWDHTDVEDINAGKAVYSVRYFNIAGQEMAQPSGLIIQVTTYTDGTVSSTKVVK